MAYTAPTRCRNGHELGPWKVSLHWLLCHCATATGGGHHEYWCNTCHDRQVPECVDASQQHGFEPPGGPRQAEGS